MIQWELVSGAPVKAQNLTVTPQARVLALRWGPAGFVWSRPVAVLVEQEGRVERRRIPDVTRIAQLGLVGLGLLFAAIAFSKRASERRQTNEQLVR